MYTRSLAPLAAAAASLLITAGIMVSLAVSVTHAPRTTPTLIEGMPVINLPAITVTATIAKPTVASRHAGQHTVSMGDSAHPLSGLIKGAAVQVVNSHLNMPYYSFGSGIGQAGKD